MVICQKCGHEVPREDSYTRNDQNFCEDCYIGVTGRVQTCDPMAVRSAVQFRKKSNLEATEGLTELQREMVEFIKSSGRAAVEELLTTFNLTPQELENQIAILRHCELVKGQKEGSNVYISPF